MERAYLTSHWAGMTARRFLNQSDSKSSIPYPGSLTRRALDLTATTDKQLSRAHQESHWTEHEKTSQRHSAVGPKSHHRLQSTSNFLDITLNLNNGKYYPYRKPNDRPVYINKDSNHPPSIIKNLPASISRRVLDGSYVIKAFNDAAPVYSDALRSSGYTKYLERKAKLATQHH